MTVDLERRVPAELQQAELHVLLAQGRITAVPVVHRVRRSRLGGGFGDAGKRPFGWALVVVVDGQPRRVASARGGTREWSGLERLERWLLDQGFLSWLVVNEIETPDVAARLPPLAPWW
jgi:hypothetical protein